MNRIHRIVSLPIVLIGAAGAVTTWSLWQTLLFARENNQLRSAFASTQSAKQTTSAGAAKTDRAELLKAETELAAARRRFRAADERAKRLAAELAITPAEELKSYGRIEDLAQNGITVLKSIEETTAGQNSAQTEGRTVSVDGKKITGWLVHTEAIGDLEANPAEIAELYAHAIQQTFALDPSLTRKVQQQLCKEFEQFRAQGLDRPHRPIEAQDDWYARRDQLVLEAAARIEAQIPTAQRKPHALAQILNLGTSFRTRIDNAPDGNPSLTLYYQVPGLPAIRF